MSIDGPSLTTMQFDQVVPVRPLNLCAKAARGALSANTERARRSDFEIFQGWCMDRGESALPADPETVAAFVESMAETRAPATVSRYVASIAAAHRTAGAGEHATAEPVRLALRRMHRQKGRRQEQALGLTFDLRQRLLEASGDRLIDDRNRALLSVAYDSLLRRSELVALEVSDIAEDACGAATVLVRSSKADPEGSGEIVYLACDSMELVRAWLGRSGVSEGRLFRSLRRGPAWQRSRCKPGSTHLQGHGQAREAARRDRGAHFRAQHPGRGGAGHGRIRNRHAGDPSGWSVEDAGNGEPLWRAPACAAQRRGAACPIARPRSASIVAGTRNCLATPAPNTWVHRPFSHSPHCCAWVTWPEDPPRNSDFQRHGLAPGL